MLHRLGRVEFFGHRYYQVAILVPPLGGQLRMSHLPVTRRRLYEGGLAHTS